MKILLLPQLSFVKLGYVINSGISASESLSLDEDLPVEYNNLFSYMYSYILH